MLTLARHFSGRAPDYLNNLHSRGLAAVCCVRVVLWRTRADSVDGEAARRSPPRLVYLAFVLGAGLCRLVAGAVSLWRRVAPGAFAFSMHITVISCNLLSDARAGCRLYRGPPSLSFPLRSSLEVRAIRS